MMSNILRISDHAVLRYLARVKGIDVEKARDEIATSILSAVEKGATRAVEADGVTYVLEHQSVVTVLGPDMRVKK
jgi:hypothetical protein